MPLLQVALMFDAVEVPRRAECLAAIRAALDTGVDLNARRAFGRWTPLHWAAQFNTDAEAVTVETLVAAGADVRAKNSYEGEPLGQLAMTMPKQQQRQ